MRSSILTFPSFLSSAKERGLHHTASIFNNSITHFTYLRFPTRHDTIRSILHWDGVFRSQVHSGSGHSVGATVYIWMGFSWVSNAWCRVLSIERDEVVVLDC
jgi:hypothetical protein